MPSDPLTVNGERWEVAYPDGWRVEISQQGGEVSEGVDGQKRRPATTGGLRMQGFLLTAGETTVAEARARLAVLRSGPVTLGGYLHDGLAVATSSELEIDPEVGHLAAIRATFALQSNE